MQEAAYAAGNIRLQNFMAIIAVEQITVSENKVDASKKRIKKQQGCCDNSKQ